MTLPQWRDFGNEVIFAMKKMWFQVLQSTICNEKMGWTTGEKNRLWLQVKVKRCVTKFKLTVELFCAYITYAY